jgi:predicted transcriptional regulator
MGHGVAPYWIGAPLLVPDGSVPDNNGAFKAEKTATRKIIKRRTIMANKGERKVKDLMLPIEDYPKISEDGTIREAFEALEKTKHRALLVTDKKGVVIGQLSNMDILMGLEPRYDCSLWAGTGFTCEVFKNYPVFYREGMFAGQAQAQVDRKVKEILAPIKVAVDEDATLAEAVNLMATHNLGRLAVLRKEKIVGMIRIDEIFDEMQKVVLGR